MSGSEYAPPSGSGVDEATANTIQKRVERMLADGWRFEWNLNTGFIGASHQNGGQFSVCEISPRSGIMDKDQTGLAFTRWLNEGAPFVRSPNKGIDGKAEQ